MTFDLHDLYCLLSSRTLAALWLSLSFKVVKIEVIHSRGLNKLFQVVSAAVSLINRSNMAALTSSRSRTGSSVKLQSVCGTSGSSGNRTDGAVSRSFHLLLFASFLSLFPGFYFSADGSDFLSFFCIFLNSPFCRFLRRVGSFGLRPHAGFLSSWRQSFVNFLHIISSWNSPGNKVLSHHLFQQHWAHPPRAMCFILIKKKRKKTWNLIVSLSAPLLYAALFSSQVVGLFPFSLLSLNRRAMLSL